jgi:Tfp pilus assembly pilus retraction ATPase PilT
VHAGDQGRHPEGKTHQIYSLMQAGQKYGMQTMNMALLQAVLDKQLPPGACDWSERPTAPSSKGMLGKVMRAAA